MKNILNIIFVLFALIGKTQTAVNLYEKHFVKENKILFRISPANKKFFDLVKNNSLKITRFESQNGNLVNETIIEKTLMPYWIADTLNWMRLMRKDKNKTAFVYQALYGNNTDVKLNASEKEKQEKMLYDLMLLSCDFNREIARACGLFFSDSSISKEQQYVYKIELNAPGLAKKEILKINVNPVVLSVNKKIEGLSGKSKANITTLKWNAANYTDDYSGYYVERSSDSINFKAVNVTPVILFGNQTLANKDFIFYNDTMPEVSKKYFYRIRGINVFGEQSEPSDIIANLSSPRITSGLLIDSINVIGNTQIFVRWRMEKIEENNLLKKFILMRSEKDNGTYNVVFESKNKFDFVDLKPLQANFYKAGAISFNNDTIFSFSRMALISDTIPPTTPVNLKAIADKKGNIKLTWNANKESDFLGYKLFKANSKTDEFVQVNNKFIKDTFYIDKLNLKTLTKNIYYAISVSDNNFNTSERSVAIEVKRPDTIAPSAPILNNLYPGLTGVRLKFILSNSDDVSRHIIIRKSSTSNSEIKIKTILSKDSISEITDSTAEFGEIYSYRIKAFDNDSNFSVSKNLSVRYETGFRKKLTDINYTVDRTLKNINLSWNYSEKGVEKFILYRANEKEPMTIIKTVAGKTLSYSDNSPHIGNIYEYRIKAVLYNGAESIISDAIKIIY